MARRKLKALSVETGDYEKDTPGKLRDLNWSDQQVETDYSMAKSKVRTPVSDVNSNDSGWDQLNKTNLMLQSLLLRSNQRLQGIVDELSRFRGRDSFSELVSENDAKMEEIYKRQISKSRFKINHEKHFEEKQINSKKGEECVVCNLSTCVYEEDVLMYCEGCNMMVHRMCVSVDEREMNSSSWYCASCNFKMRVKKIGSWISGILQKVHSPKKLQSHVFSKNFDELMSLGEIQCIACGREGGMFFEVQGLEGEFCHASCAYWLDELSISPRAKKVFFINEEDASQRMDKDDENHSFFLHKKFRKIDILVKRFLKGSKKDTSMQDFMTNLTAIYEESVNNLDTTEKYVVKSARKRKHIKTCDRNLDTDMQSHCVCLFSSRFWDFVKKRILKVSKNALIGKNMKEYDFEFATKAKINSQIKKKSFLIYKLFTLLNSAKFFKLGASLKPKKHAQRGKCSDCHKPFKNKCKICNISKGLVVKCYHKGCNNHVHVECARRVNCELGFPLNNLSNEKVHSVFCDQHSKSPGYRTRQNFKRLKEKEISMAEKNVNQKWAESLKKRSHFDQDMNNENVSNNLKRKVEATNIRNRNNVKIHLKKSKKSRFFISLCKERGPKKNKNIFLELEKGKMVKNTKSVVWNLKKVKREEHETLLINSLKIRRRYRLRKLNSESVQSERLLSHDKEDQFNLNHYSESEGKSFGNGYSIKSIDLSKKIKQF